MLPTIKRIVYKENIRLTSTNAVNPTGTFDFLGGINEIIKALNGKKYIKLGIRVEAAITTGAGKAYAANRLTVPAVLDGLKMQIANRMDGLNQQALDLIDMRGRIQNKFLNFPAMQATEAAGADSYRTYLEIDYRKDKQKGIYPINAQGMTLNSVGKAIFTNASMSLSKFYSTLPATWSAVITITLIGYELHGADFVREANYVYLSHTGSDKTGQEVDLDLTPDFITTQGKGEGLPKALDLNYEDITLVAGGGVMDNAVDSIKFLADGVGARGARTDNFELDILDINELADEAYEEGSVPVANTKLSKFGFWDFTEVGDNGRAVINDDGQPFTKHYLKVNKKNADLMETLTKINYKPIQI